MTAAILQELAVDLRGEPSIHEIYALGDVLEIFHRVTGSSPEGVKRFTVGVRGESLELTETSGPAKLGKTCFDLADPRSFELALAHIRDRLSHWAELARIFAKEDR